MRDFKARKRAKAAASVLTNFGRRAARAWAKAGVASTTASVTSRAAGNASDIAGKVADKASDLAAKAAETATDLVDSAQETASDMAGKAADIAGSVGDQAARAGEHGASASTPLRDWLTELLSVVGSKTAETVSRGSMVGLLESVLTSLQQRAADTVDSAGDAGANASHVKVDPDLIAQLGRLLVTAATSQNGVFTPHSRDAREAVQESVDTRTQPTDAWVSVGKIVLSALADAVVTSLQQNEERPAVPPSAGPSPRATSVTAPGAANLPAAIPASVLTALDTALPKQPRPHLFRWFVLGLLVGACIAYVRGRQEADDAMWDQPAATGQSSSTPSYRPAPSAQSQDKSTPSSGDAPITNTDVTNDSDVTAS